MLLSVFGGDMQDMAIAATIMMTIEGPPVIPYGEEVGRRGGIWPDNRQVMAWGTQDIMPGAGVARNETLRQVFVDLIELRKNRDSLRADHFEVVYSNESGLISRRGGDVMVAINMGENDIELPLDELPLEAVWNLTFSSIGSLTGELERLPARSAQIFVDAYQTYSGPRE
jgi:glycosidase